MTKKQWEERKALESTIKSLSNELFKRAKKLYLSSDDILDIYYNLMQLDEQECMLDKMKELLSDNGYIIVKLDTMEQVIELKKFVHTELLPNENEFQNKFTFN